MVSKIEKMLAEAQKKRIKEPLPSSEFSRISGVERSRGLRVLVIDGGGSRGIVAASILRKLENLMTEKLGGAKVHLADHFDLIAGTSAGGMIALAHGHQRPQLDDIVKFFVSGKAFQPTKSNGTLVPGTVSTAASLGGFNKFSGKKLEKLLKQTFDNGPLDGGKEGRALRKAERNDLQPDPDAKRPRVFALASPARSLKAGIFFTNYGRDEYVREAIDTTDMAPLICSSVPAWAAARATSAAPTYFSAAKIPIPEDNNRVHCFWDGGLVNNSPVIEAVTQTEMLFGYDREFELIVSIGCGEYSAEQNVDLNVGSGLSERSLEKNFKTGGTTLREDLAAAVVLSEKEFQTAKRSLMSNPRTRARAFDRIYRLNPTFHRKLLAMDENKRQELEEAQKETESWCDSENMKMQMEEIARILMEPQEYLKMEKSRRARALECTTRFFPPLVRLTEEEKNELQRDGLSDDRELYKEDAEKWIEKYQTCIVPILEFLESPDSQVVAAASDIERCRFTLWRCYLNRLILFVKSLSSEDLKREFLRKVGLENILRIEKSLLPLDRMNALGVMKIDRERPFCPPGIAWISKSHLKILGEGLDLKFGKQKQRPSIDKNHFVLLNLFDDVGEKEFVRQLEKLCLPVLPDWMQEWQRYTNNGDFGKFYEKWQKVNLQRT